MSRIQFSQKTVPILSNGSALEQQQDNIQGTLLASAARTVTTDSPNQINYNARGATLFLNVTTASGTGGLIMKIRIVDPISGNLSSLVAGTNVTATGLYILQLYPLSSSNYALPRTWIAEVAHGDATSYTYSLGYSLIL